MPQAKVTSLFQSVSASTGCLVRKLNFLFAWAVIFSAASITTPIAHAQTLSTIYSFAGEPDGSTPYGPLIRDAEGNLYGTTGHGGADNAGTVFKIDNQGVETILHSFNGASNGGGPFAGLARDHEGNLYGTTGYGGAHNLGTVFKVSPTGEARVLYSFSGPPDGASPFAGVILDAQGNIYGTTSNGGTGSCPAVGQEGCGSVYVLTKSGNERVIYSFQGGESDGAFPNSLLVRGADGNFYGTTSTGGCLYSPTCGTVFRITKDGVEKVLHRFGGDNDGAGPNGVIFGPGGILYGTTYSGGGNDGGMVFGLTLAGAEIILYHFGSTSNDGINPGAGLLWYGGETFYGTTEMGGGPGCLTGCGTIFRVTTAGVETVVYSFSDNPSGGFIPFATVIRDPSGNLYGTTGEGGPTDNGTVFEVTP